MRWRDGQVARGMLLPVATPGLADRVLGHVSHCPPEPGWLLRVLSPSHCPVVIDIHLTCP